eukprot:NODE_306_length_11344_cov_0.675767.p2 type:complete len:667 gc:universal NODE_306_length_11344_cov_0.675767:618-2618(+)
MKSLIQKSDILLIYTKSGSIIGINKDNGREQFRNQISPLINVKSSKDTLYHYQLDTDGNLFYGTDGYLEKLSLNMRDLVLLSPSRNGQIIITGSVENSFIMVKNGQVKPVNNAKCMEDGITVGISTYKVRMLHIIDDVSWDLVFTKLHGHDKLVQSDLVIENNHLHHSKWSFEFDDDIIGYFDAKDNGILHYQLAGQEKSPSIYKPPPSCEINSPFYPNCALVPSTEVLIPSNVESNDSLVLISLIAIFMFVILYRRNVPQLVFSRIVVANFEISSASTEFAVSPDVLGNGSNGTIVFRGTFNNRPVAIKRMLRNFQTLAEQEVELLKSADLHENIVRMFFLSKNLNFIFLVLELCAGHLDHFIQQHYMYDEKSIMLQITNGLGFLHSKNIIHRDLKPLNILYTDSLVFKITDFGLGKQLLNNKSSFSTISSGTKGWRCPEILRMLEDPDWELRLTNKIDIFALGCLYHYILSHGIHPFGKPFEREMNILMAKPVLNLSNLNENDSAESHDLITIMTYDDSIIRPEISVIKQNCLFWSLKSKLSFVCNLSNRLETENRSSSLLLQELELLSVHYRNDWSIYIDPGLFLFLNGYRTYHPHLIQDLLRSIRNLVNHFQQLSSSVYRILSDDIQPNNICVIEYYLKHFPDLMLKLVEYSQSVGLYQDCL